MEPFSTLGLQATVSLEYLLLPPRSALKAVPLRVTPHNFITTFTLPPTCLNHTSPFNRTMHPDSKVSVLVLERHPFSGPIHSAGKLLHTS